jgi:predicted DNA-binding transcriptional regulator AlpA
MGIKPPILKEIEQSESTLHWVDEKRVTELTGIAIQTLRNWRFQGTGPAYFKIGRSVRYRLSDIISYMDARRVDPK